MPPRDICRIKRNVVFVPGPTEPEFEGKLIMDIVESAKENTIIHRRHQSGIERVY